MELWTSCANDSRQISKSTKVFPINIEAETLTCGLENMAFHAMFAQQTKHETLLVFALNHFDACIRHVIQPNGT